MQYRKLGDSDLVVSELGLGSLIFAGETPIEIASSCVNRAVDCGINFFDTANMYGRGAAEVFLGHALQKHARHTYILATKAYFPMSDVDKGLSRAQIHKQVDDSLRRLQTDYVDLFQCHRYDEDTPLEETMEALCEVVRVGKVRYIGFSEWPLEKIQQSFSLACDHRFVASQPQYSMLWRAPERDIFPSCSRYGIGQLAYSPLTQGVLTGKYEIDAPPPAGSRATHHYMGGWISGYLTDPVRAAVSRMSAIAREAGLTTSQLALAWILRQPAISSAIIGASNPEHVRSNVLASGTKVDPAVMAEVDRITAEVALS